MSSGPSSADQQFLDDLDAISVYGQGKRTERPFGRAKRARRVRPNFTRPKQSNPITWRLAAMNMATNENQSRTLATLRDTLLPKLLSGELPTT